MDLPLQLQTAYQDLLQHHFAEPPLTIERIDHSSGEEGQGGRTARQRLGEKVVEVAIGPDVAEVKAQVEQALSEQEIRKIWLRSASADVAILRAGRCLAPDMQTGRLLAAIAKAGFSRLAESLGGTQAFRHYPLMLEVESARSEGGADGGCRSSDACWAAAGRDRSKSDHTHRRARHLAGAGFRA